MGDTAERRAQDFAEVTTGVERGRGYANGERRHGDADFWQTEEAEIDEDQERHIAHDLHVSQRACPQDAPSGCAKIRGNRPQHDAQRNAEHADLRRDLEPLEKRQDGRLDNSEVNGHWAAPSPRGVRDHAMPTTRETGSRSRPPPSRRTPATAGSSAAWHRVRPSPGHARSEEHTSELQS